MAETPETGAPTTGPGEPADPEGRPVLHVVFALDCSGSMAGERIGSLNYAIRSALPAMQEAAADHPEVEVAVRVLRFADAVDWVIGEPIPVRGMTWTNLSAGGETSMGAALRTLAAALAAEPDPARALPPVLILVSDGMATDDAEGALGALLATELGGRAVRIPIAIGQDADLDLLQAFIGDPDLAPLRANSAEMLVNRIRWASSVPVAAAMGAQGAIGTGEAAPAETAAKAADDLLW